LDGVKLPVTTADELTAPLDTSITAAARVGATDAP
jgi:hypothetical protein